MPTVPPMNLAPEATPWGRWAQERIESLGASAATIAQNEANVNKSQNAMMKLLSKQVTTLTALTEGLQETIDGLLSENISTGNVTATGFGTFGGNVTGANLTTAGRVTSAAALRSPGSRSYVVQGGGLGSYAGAWIDGDGTVGISPSSIRFKTDIEQWVPDIERLLLLRAVLFRYDPTVFGGMDPDAHKQIGFIAEELDALGFPEFIFYDADGLIEGINYDRITVALLVLAQRQEARLQSLEARLDAAGI